MSQRSVESPRFVSRAGRNYTFKKGLSNGVDRDLMSEVEQDKQAGQDILSK